jgi:hypothetical protein
MGLRLLCVAFTIGCFVATSGVAQAEGSSAGRGSGQASGGRGQSSGNHRGGRTADGRVDGGGNDVAPRDRDVPQRGTVIRTVKEVRPTRQRSLTRRPIVGIALPLLEDSNEPDAAAPDVAPRPAASSPHAESSSIHPLQSSAPPPPLQASSRGGLRVELEPDTAQVYIDGFYVGTVQDFNRSAEGVPLAAGWHRLEFRAPGYVTPAVNVTIEANRTTSYRGALKPTRP